MKLHYPQTITEKILYILSFITIIIITIIIIGYTFHLLKL